MLALEFERELLPLTLLATLCCHSRFRVVVWTIS